MTITNRSQKRILKHLNNLADPNVKIASRAEGYLIRYYGVRAFGPLLEACDHPNPEVRLRAAWALAYTKDPRAYETVLRLNGDPDEGVRYDATLSLGILGDERAIEPLVAIAFESDESRPAEVALRDFGLQAIEPLRTLLLKGNADVRWSATQSLGNIAVEHNSKECVEILRECLADPDEYVRENARDWLENERMDS